jgi:hypothetical protein
VTYSDRIVYREAEKMSRYRIRRVPFVLAVDDAFERPYGLWDSSNRVYVNQYGKPDPNYCAASKDVAVMRRRDLNEYDRSRA